MWVEAQDSLPVTSGHHSASNSVAVTLGLDTNVTSNQELQKMLRAREGGVKAGALFPEQASFSICRGGGFCLSCFLQHQCIPTSFLPQSKMLPLALQNCTCCSHIETFGSQSQHPYLPPSSMVGTSHKSLTIDMA